MLKKVVCCFSLSMLIGAGYLNAAEQTGGVASERVDYPDFAQAIDGFINAKVVHERANTYPFGPKNCTGAALNPIFSVGDFTIDGDFYYGRQITYDNYILNERNISRITGESNHALLREKFTTIKNDLSVGLTENTKKAHFYRNYTRGLYENKSHDFRVVVGDTTTRNQIGYQNALSGIGVSIFRQTGNGSTINNSSPIVITRISKIECKLGDEILALRLFSPGVYFLDDLPEEAKIPGVTVKISDQLGRTCTLKVDYFSGYGLLEEGKDNFDITVVKEHRWNFDDPHKIRYYSKIRYSANYEYGLSDKTTIGLGVQGCKSMQLFDTLAIFSTEYGVIAPNLSFSKGDSSKAFGAGIFYALPQNDYGISWETFLGVKSKGYGDLGKGEDAGNEYNKIIDKYFSDTTLKQRFQNTSSDTTTKQIISRVYSKPVFGFTPSFTFNGLWTTDSRLREYTIALTKKIFDCTFTVSAGLTYDDPHKGANLESPDRRLTLACSIPVGDFKIRGSYSHHDDSRFAGYGNVQYNPSEIPGVEVNVDHYTRHDFRNSSASVKYDGDYCGLKAEETITNRYGDNKLHANQQRFFFETSLFQDRTRAYQKSNFNILRTGRIEKDED